ncbi:hypothetical protein D9M68_933480 [compost metagenome]
MADEQVMHAAGVRRAGHAQLASGIGAKHVGQQLAALDERLGIGGQAIAIERCTAQRTRNMRALIELQPFGEQLLPQRTFEKR